MDTFKTRFSFEQRCNESKKVLQRHRRCVPIIVEPSNIDIMKIDKTKYLVPRELTFGQFMYVIRKRLKIESQQSIFIFTNKTCLPPQTSSVQTIYDNYSEDDGFLYLTYTFENTFG